MERVALLRLQDTYFRRNPFHKAQHAFRSGRSCDSALAETVDTLESAVLNNEYALGLFLDIKGAFDNLNHKAALDLMRKKGIPGGTLEPSWEKEAGHLLLEGNSLPRTGPTPNRETFE